MQGGRPDDTAGAAGDRPPFDVDPDAPTDPALPADAAAGPGGDGAPGPDDTTGPDAATGPMPAAGSAGAADGPGPDDAPTGPMPALDRPTAPDVTLATPLPRPPLVVRQPGGQEPARPGVRGSGAGDPSERREPAPEPVPPPSDVPPDLDETQVVDLGPAAGPTAAATTGSPHPDGPPSAPRRGRHELISDRAAPGQPAVASSTLVPEQRSVGRRFARVASWVALVTGFLVLLGSGTVYGLYRHYGDKIEVLPGVGDLGVREQRGPAPQDEVYLVVGSDSADELTREQLRSIGASRSGRDETRTDTILLVQVPADGSRARVVSFPRDSLVEIPGHGKDKINAAYGYGEDEQRGRGPGTLIATVEQLSGLSVDHYVEVSLYGFVTITDALGGVEVCLTRPAKERDANIDLPAGRQVLDGRQALAFVRQRKGLPDGDLSRIRRQQYFLAAVTREVLSAGTLLNPPRLNALLNAAVGSVKVDGGTTQSDLLALALQLRGVNAGSVRFETVPVLDPYGSYGNQSVVLLDEDALPGFFADGQDDGPAVRLTVPPRSITVVVENGTGRSGQGFRVADELRDVGFRVDEVRSARRTDQTLVRHGDRRADSAQTVAAALPGSDVREDATVGRNGVVVTLGSDYAGVRSVKVQAPRDPSTDRAPAPRTAADDDCIA